MRQITCILMLSSFAAGAYAQDSKSDSTRTIFEFTLRDGSKIVGELLNQNNEYYWVKTSNFGTVKIEFKQVVSVVLREGKNQALPDKEKSKTSFYENQFGFKYFLISTAIPTEKNKWYYTNQYAIFSGFTYGVNRYLSVGASLFTFVPTNFFSPNLKITLNPDSKFKVAVNGQYYLVRNTNGFGIIQALFTSGDAQNNFTFGYTQVLSSKTVDACSFLTFGFAKKVANKLSVISENHVIIPSASSTANTLGFLSGGVRFDRRMHAFDLGIYVPTNDLDRSIILIPYLGFNVKMNK